MSASPEALTHLDLCLPRVSSGKVREIFDAGAGGMLLLVATDRISAYDVVMAQGIPDKGKLLTGMSVFWFELTGDICPNHCRTSSAQGLAPDLGRAVEGIEGRFMIVERLEMLPVEFVVRGYLTGSGWADYRRTGAVCGVKLPPGLREAEKLPEPIFTPATKATEGHDQNITEEHAGALCPPGTLEVGKGYAIDLYLRAADHAAERGIIVADTKFEFGLSGGEVVLADEVLTPDSSRFWLADLWAPGASPPPLDKQYLRNWLDAQGWDRTPPPPDLPPGVIERTRAGYLDAYERLVGSPFEG